MWYRTGLGNLLLWWHGIVLWPEISYSHTLAFSTGQQWVNTGHSSSWGTFPRLHAAHFLFIQTELRAVDFHLFLVIITLHFSWLYSVLRCNLGFPYALPLHIHNFVWFFLCSCKMVLLFVSIFYFYCRKCHFTFLGYLILLL